MPISTDRSVHRVISTTTLSGVRRRPNRRVARRASSGKPITPPETCLRWRDGQLGLGDLDVQGEPDVASRPDSLHSMSFEA